MACLSSMVVRSSADEKHCQQDCGRDNFRGRRASWVGYDGKPWHLVVMAMDDDPGTYWNDDAGPRWVAAQADLDRMMVHITERLMHVAAPMEGEHVIDVGCGCGTTTMAIAERVGSGGRVIGVDISKPMLAHARSRTEAANVSHALGDAATYAFDESSADMVFSRFGVMFFADSTTAFRNLRKALKPGGRCVFACWQTREQNPWMTFPLRAAAAVLPVMEPPAEDAPGPFRFADQERLTSMLRDAGFTSVEIEPVEVEVVFDGTVSEIMGLFQQVGPLSRAVAELEPSRRDEALELVRTALSERHDGHRVTWTSGSLVVCAR